MFLLETGVLTDGSFNAVGANRVGVRAVEQSYRGIKITSILLT